MAAPHRIDCHHHFVPPAYKAEILKKQPMQPVMEKWTVQGSIADMDKAGTQTAIVSITTPGIHFGSDAAARHLTRLCNDYAVEIARDHPGRFGLFAALPWPDVDGSLEEVAHALDTLKADGIGLYTSYGDTWLGHASFAPLFEELNRRKAIVYVHPVCAPCVKDLLPDVNESVVEYGTDTTRAIVNLLATGSLARWPNITWIWSHAGGTMPFLIERLVSLSKSPKVAAHLPQGLMHELRKMYYDTAQAANASALGCLKSIVPVSQIVFGTDYPYRTSIEHVEGLARSGFTPAELQAIDRDNALRLVPRYK
jgi:predicted TIM-barrel fold metal-dependent hydrolase